jgi:hypothetical protein
MSLSALGTLVISILGLGYSRAMSLRLFLGRHLLNVDSKKFLHLLWSVISGCCYIIALGINLLVTLSII